MRTTKRYGWKPDLPHHKLFRMAAPLPTESLPALVDLRPKCPPVYDQGNLGSCTGNAWAGLVQFLMRMAGMSDWVPSRLLIYLEEREVEGDIDQDNGAQLGDGATCLETKGVCPELEWPYDTGRFSVIPPATVMNDAAKTKILSPTAIPQNLGQLKAHLAGGRPFVLGISVFESFESQEVEQTGMVPMPGANEECVGGHAVLAVGYDDSKNCFIVRNSWGVGWGISGYFYLPYSYVTNQGLASDFWTATGLVTENSST